MPSIRRSRSYRRSTFSTKAAGLYHSGTRVRISLKAVSAARKYDLRLGLVCRCHPFRPREEKDRGLLSTAPSLGPEGLVRTRYLSPPRLIRSRPHSLTT